MLAYLDSLCQALARRDDVQIRRHLSHPLARILPPAVRTEVLAIARAGHQGNMAAVRTLHFYYQTLQLLAVPHGDATPDEPFLQAGHAETVCGTREPQMV